MENIKLHRDKRKTDLKVGGESAVTAEDFVVQDGGDGKTIEAVGERLPQFDRKTPLAFVVETVNSGEKV